VRRINVMKEEKEEAEVEERINVIMGRILE
jgi:hypothetical protein